MMDYSEELMKDIIYHGHCDEPPYFEHGRRYTLVAKFGYEYDKFDNGKDDFRLIANIGLATSDPRKVQYNKKYGVKIAGGRSEKNPIMKIKGEMHFPDIEDIEETCRLFRNAVKHLIFDFGDWMTYHDIAYDTHFAKKEWNKRDSIEKRIKARAKFCKTMSDLNIKLTIVSHDVFIGR